MRAHIRKWGNSASVRIPAALLASSAIGIDQAVDIREEGGRIVIEPVRGPVYDLDRLLERMTPETFPEEVDFGPPVGSESW